MASSRQDQSSYATASESAFTKQWIDAALSKSEGSILYRDIQAALADAFVANPDQTPFFVNQGTGLEVFSTVSDDMRAMAASRAKSAPSPQLESDVVQKIEAAVADRDSDFVTRDAAIAALEKSKTALLEWQFTDPLVSRFYTKSFSTDTKLPAIPRARAVADFAQEQGWSKKYFVKINTESVKVRLLKDPLSTFSVVNVLRNRDESEYVWENRLRPASLESTDPLPFEVMEVAVTSKRPSLPAFAIYVGVIHSLTEVMVLSSTVRLTQKNWETKAPNLSEVQWRYQSYPWGTVVADPNILWQESVTRSQSDIRSYLESLVPSTESAEATLPAPQGAPTKEPSNDGDASAVPRSKT